MNASRDQCRIVHTTELRRYSERKSLQARLDCELDLTNDSVRLNRLNWILARLANSGQVFLGKGIE